MAWINSRHWTWNRTAAQECIHAEEIFMRTSWPCWLKQVPEARDWVQSSTSIAFLTPMGTVKENVADFPEMTQLIISQANDKTNFKKLRSCSMTFKDQRVRVKKVCQKKHAEWCQCHATKHCIIKCERIAMATYKSNRLDAVTSSRATQRYTTGIECQHGLISLNSRMIWTL